MTEEVGAPAIYRVVYVGTERRREVFGPLKLKRHEQERTWRQRLAQEQEDACAEMSRQGLRLVNVVPVLSSADLRGGWTEGVWLYFAGADTVPI